MAGTPPTEGEQERRGGRKVPGEPGLARPIGSRVHFRRLSSSLSPGRIPAGAADDFRPMIRTGARPFDFRRRHHHHDQHETATANRRARRAQARVSSDRARRASTPIPASIEAPRLARNNDRAGTPEAIYPRHDLVKQREQPELPARGEHDARQDQDQPPPDAPPIGRPRHGDDRQGQRNQADRGDRLPVILVPEVIRRSAQGPRAEELEGVDREKVVSARQAEGKPGASEAPGLGHRVGNQLDADQADREHQCHRPGPPEPAGFTPTPGEHRGHSIEDRPGTQGDEQVKPLLRVAGKEGRRQDQGQGQRRTRLTSMDSDRRVEGPGIPAGGPDVGVMAFERLRQHVRRRLDAAGRHCSSPSAHPERPTQSVSSQPGEQQVADGDPAEHRRSPGPPGQPGRRIEEAGLRVPDERSTAEPSIVPAREVTHLRDRSGDRQVVGQEQAGQVIAGRGVIDGSGMVEARAVGVDEQGGRIGHQPGEAGQAERRKDEHRSDQPSVHGRSGLKPIPFNEL